MVVVVGEEEEVDKIHNNNINEGGLPILVLMMLQVAIVGGDHGGGVKVVS